MAGLTAKQEAFAVAYFETGNAAEAYRKSYNAEKMTPQAVWTKASELLAGGKVRGRVDALQAKAAEQASFTVHDAYLEYEEARQLALKVDNPSAAVSATAGKVKLFGLEPPLKTKTEHSGLIQTQEVSAREILASKLARLAARGGPPQDAGKPD